MDHWERKEHEANKAWNQQQLAGARARAQAAAQAERNRQNQERDRQRRDHDWEKTLRKEEQREVIEAQRRADREEGYIRRRNDQLEDKQNAIEAKQASDLARAEAAQELTQLQHALTPEQLRWVFDDWVDRENIRLQSLETELRIRRADTRLAQADELQFIAQQEMIMVEGYLWRKIIDCLMARLMGGHGQSQAQAENILFEQFQSIMNP